MITWLTGNTGAGKTSYAKYLRDNKLAKLWDELPIILDGDEVRKVWLDLRLSKEDRRKNNLRVARLAKLLEGQGFEVIVAVICPYEKLRQAIKEYCGCQFIYMPDGHIADETHPYEIPQNPDKIVRKSDFTIKD